MRERTFRKPRVRDLITRVMGNIPVKIDEKFLLRLVNNGVLHQVQGSYADVVSYVEELPENHFLLLPSDFRVPAEDSNYGIKSLSDLVKIDSQQVLNRVSPDAPEKLTKTFAQQHQLWPAILINKAVSHQDVENPPIGFYWVGSDGHARATTWLRSVTGAEMEIMKKQGDFEGGVIDRKPYGNNLRVKVSSREEDMFYEFTLSRLPMHKRGDPAQYSDWINLGHNSNDPDSSYRGVEHGQRENPVIFFSAPTIFAFYEAMRFVGQHPDWKQFRINPFPIPTDAKMIDFIDKLRLRTLILDDSKEDLEFNPLNKTEIDRLIGARTILRGYRNCWHHWGKRDCGYLYRPE